MCLGTPSLKVRGIVGSVDIISGLEDRAGQYSSLKAVIHGRLHTRPQASGKWFISKGKDLTTVSRISVREEVEIQRVMFLNGLLRRERRGVEALPINALSVIELGHHPIRRRRSPRAWSLALMRKVPILFYHIGFVFIILIETSTFVLEKFSDL